MSILKVGYNKAENKVSLLIAPDCRIRLSSEEAEKLIDNLQVAIKILNTKTIHVDTVDEAFAIIRKLDGK